MGISNIGVNIQVTASGAQLVQTMNAALAEFRNLLASAATGTKRTSDVSNELLGRILALTAAFRAANMFGEAIAAGFEFNKTIEQATLGIATLITAQTQLHDRNGVLLGGTEALGQAQLLAADQVNKLRIAGIQTAATTQELITAFQQGIGAGLKWGLTLDQIRQITIGVTQAAQALGVPMNQLNEEVRDLIAGNISIRNTRIASALGITNEDIRNAREAGNLAGFITDKLQAFNVAGNAASRTWQGVTSNVREALQVFAGDATKPLFDGLKTGLQEALEGVFDLETAQVSDKFAEILEVAKSISGDIGEVLVDGLRGVIEEAQEFNVWLQENRQSVQAIIDATGELAGQLGTTIGLVATLGLNIGDVGTKTGFWEHILTGAADIIATINSLIQLMGLGLGVVAQTIMITVVQALVNANRLAAGLVGIFNKDAARTISQWADGGQAAIDKVSAAVNNYADELAHGGLAIDQFLAKVQKNQEARGNLPILEDVRKATTQIKEEQAKLEQDDGVRLQRREISQKQHEANIRKIRIDSINQQIEAVSNAEGKLSGEDAQRAAQKTILELIRQRKLIEAQATVAPVTLPDDKKALREAEQVAIQKLEAQKKAAAEEAKIREDIAKSSAAQDESALKLRVTREEITQTQFDTQRISREQELNDQLLKIRAESLEKQIALQSKVVETTTDPSNKEKEKGRLAELRADELKIIADYDARREALEAEAQQRAAETAKRLGEEGTRDQIAILRARGQNVDAVRLEMVQQYRVRLKELEAIGTEEARTQAKAIQDLIAANINKAQFDDLEKTATRALDSLENRLTETQQLSEAGQLRGREKQERVVAAYEDTRQVLGSILPQLEALARDSKNPEAIADVEQLRLKYNQLGITLSQLRDGFAQLKSGLRDAGERALEGFLNDSFNKLTSAGAGKAEVDSIRRSLASANAELQGLLVGPPSAEAGERITELRKEIRTLNVEMDQAKEQADSWGNLFVKAIAAVVQELGNLLARMAAVAAFNFLTGLLPGLGGGGGGGLKPSAVLSGDVPNIPHAASGGWVVGGRPGVDSVHVLTMEEEFILRAPATREIRRLYGEGWLENLNRLGGGMNVPPPPPRIRPNQQPYRMADGGFVPSASALGGSASELRGRILVEHSEDTIIRTMKSDAGLEIFFRQIESNADAIRNILGVPS